MSRMHRAVTILAAVGLAVAGTAVSGTGLPAGFSRVWPVEPLTDLTCLAVSDGGVLVAGGPGPRLVVSPDGGETWERVALPEGVSGIRAVAWGGGRFMAVSSSGDVLLGSNGENWTVHPQDPPLDWVEDAAWSGDGFVAVGGKAVDEGAPVSWARVAVSGDGVEWSVVHQESLSYGEWPREIAVVGEVLVAAPFGNSDPYLPGVLASRDRGRTWEPVDLGFVPDHVTAMDDGFYVLDRAWVDQDGKVERPAASSGDGLTWRRLDASSLGTAGIEGVAWTGGRLIAVSEKGTAESTDGSSWRWLDGPPAAPRPRFGRLGLLSGVGLVAVGREETVLSLAGSHWRVLTTRGLPDLARLAASPDRLVAVGDAWLPGMGPLMGSTDGVNWEPLAAPETLRRVTDVVWTGERFVAAAGASLLVSDDGVAWRELAPGGAVVYGLAVVPGGVLAVGDGGGGGEGGAGVVLWSSDGLSWEVRTTVGAGLLDVACTSAGDACVAVGWSGLAAAGTPDGPWQESYLAPEDPSMALSAVATHGGRWVAAGSAGVFTSADGTGWEPAQKLSPSFAYTVGGDDVAWVGDSFLAVDPASGTDAPLAGWMGRSLDGRWWGTVTEEPGEFRHVALADGTAWLLGAGGRIALGEPAPSPAAPAGYTYLLPAVAHTPGLAGTLWRSDLFLAPGAGTAGVSADLFLLTSGEGAAAASRRRVTVGFAETLPVEDLVGSGFGADGVTGAVLVRADGPLAGWSRTFTRSPDGGTYGQMIPLVPLAGLEPVQDLIGLEESVRFRTNLGLVNAGPETVTARVEVRGTLGELLAARDVELPPFSLTLHTHFLRELGLAPVENTWVRVLFPFTQEHPNPPCLAFASVVDEGTGDPTLVMPQQAADGEQLVPVVVHLPGYNDTLWRTDLEVVNTTGAGARFEMEFWPADGLAPPVSSPRFELAPGAAVRYPDVVATALGTGDKGALVVRCLEGAVAVRSRTYTVTAAGSFGQAVPAEPLADSGLRFGQWIGLPLEAGEEPPFRVNIGVVNPSGVVRELTFWGPDNPDLKSWLLPPHTLHQLDHALRPESAGWAPRVHVAFACWEGPVTGYASIVDNRTGDPTFIPAQPR